MLQKMLKNCLNMFEVKCKESELICSYFEQIPLFLEHWCRSSKYLLHYFIKHLGVNR